MKVAVLGYGTVGKSVVEIITNKFKDIEVKYILVKSLVGNSDSRFVDDFEIIVNDDEVEVVLEMINGDEPTFVFLKAALSAKKHVVSSNKMTIANHLAEYLKLAEENGVQIRFEASVAGGIYWLQSLIKTGRIDQVTKIMGIMNGTSNYILDHIFKEHKSFESILKKASELGYAEQDPSSDIEGYDVLRKIMISSSLAYHTLVDIDSIFISGIQKVKLEYLDHLAKFDYRVKLIGYSELFANSYYACVEPIAFKINDTFASVNDNFNLVALEGDNIGRLEFYGQGAGGNPTACAMIQDLLDIKDNRKDKLDLNNKLKLRKDVGSNRYFIFTKVAIEDYIESNDGRMYKTRLINHLEKEELITKTREIDPDLFYVRVGE